MSAAECNIRSILAKDMLSMLAVSCQKPRAMARGLLSAAI